MKELEVRSITNKKGSTVGYRTTAIGYKAPSKDNQGRVGLALEYRERTDALYAIVRGVRVYITPNNDGYCVIHDNSANQGYSLAADNKLVQDMVLANNEAIHSYLCSRYNITNRKYSFLKDLAINGKALLTKAEMKEQYKALSENK